MEDEDCWLIEGVVDKVGNLLLGEDVDGSLNVTSLVFVWVPAVDNGVVGNGVIELSTQQLANLLKTKEKH